MKKITTQFRMPVVMMAVALIMVFAFGSCNNKVTNAAKRFKEAAAQITDNPDDYYGGWSECGLRLTGEYLSSLISLDDLQGMLPCPLYLSGPHTDGEWHFYSDDFGHYNPEAVSFLGDVAKKVVSDKNFVNATKPIVDKYLHRQMLIAMVEYDGMHDASVFNGDPYDMNVLLNYMLDSYYDPYGFLFSIGQTIDMTSHYDEIGWHFLSFWARRNADGTMDLFYDALKTVFMAYYPDYKFSSEDYLNDMYYYEDWGGEDYWYYDDSPISDDERLNENESVEMIRAAVGNLDYSYNILPEYDLWPESDLRCMGSHLASLISLRTLNAMLPCDLYLSGPHAIGHWELYDDEDFGHYNPEAVKYLSNLANRVVSDKSFVSMTKPLVDEYLHRQMFIMLTLYEAMNDKNICSDRKAVLSTSLDRKGYVLYSDENPARAFLEKVTIGDDTYVYHNYRDMFLYFWARRDEDGTADLFYKALKNIYLAYYPDYKYNPSSWVEYAAE